MAPSPESTLRQLTGPGNLWSHSNLERWAACPYQWFGRYVLKIPDMPSAPLVQGTLCHGALAHALTTNQAPVSWVDAVTTARQQDPASRLVPVTQDATLAAWCADAWAQRPTAPTQYAETAWLAPVALTPKAPRPTCTMERAEAVLHRGEQYAWFQAQDAVRAMGVDAIFVQPDWVGITDRRVQVLDWKTSQVKPGQSVHQVAGRYHAQVALYGLLAQRRFQPAHLTTAIALLPARTTVHLPLSPTILAQTARTAADRIWAIKAAAARGAAGFPKTVGPGCRFCSVSQWPDGCPEGAQYRRTQGWDRWDAQNRTEREQAGVQWAGDA